MQKIRDFQHAVFYCDQPNQKIYDFVGLYEREDLTTKNKAMEPMNLENSMWANTVLASSHIVLGLVIYTGRQTRSQMNQRLPSDKMALLD